MTDMPEYVYVASSWRCDMHTAVCAILDAANIAHYNFRDAEGFAWQDVNTNYTQGDLVSYTEYMEMLQAEEALMGFLRDFEAMEKADTFVLVNPCGRSAHLEMGWAIGKGKRTAILLEDPTEPDLMYLMADAIISTPYQLLEFLDVPN